MKRTAALLAALLLPIGTAACSSGESAGDSIPTAGDARTSSTAAEQPPDEELPADAVALLADYDVEGQGVREVIDHLDQLDQTRPLAIQGSVRADEVVFGAADGEVVVPIPGDQVYVSVAPFREQTHDCHYHALGSCQGELVGEDVQVTITTDDGEVLVDEEEATTYANGFVGFWLPEDHQGTVTVTQGELTGETPFDTGEGGATCITTLQLR